MSYNIYIDLPEANSIKMFTALYPDIETGGDLFGYWLDDNTCIVKLATGPGLNVGLNKDGARRTSVAFNQDSTYLRHVAKVALSPGFLQLQQVGQWHSHHQLGLKTPSAGDIGTMTDLVETTHLTKQITIIVNIDPSHTPGRFDIKLYSYIFKKGNPTFTPANLFENNDTRQILSRYRLSQDIVDKLMPIYRYEPRYIEIFKFLSQFGENPEIMTRPLEHQPEPVRQALPVRLEQPAGPARPGEYDPLLLHSYPSININRYNHSLHSKYKQLMLDIMLRCQANITIENINIYIEKKDNIPNHARKLIKDIVKLPDVKGGFTQDEVLKVIIEVENENGIKFSIDESSINALRRAIPLLVDYV